MKYAGIIATAALFLMATAGAQAQDIAVDETVEEIKVADYADHIFSNFIVEYPKDMSAEARALFQEDVLSRIGEFYAEDSPEMDLSLCASDDLETALRQLSSRLIGKAERLTAADTTLWEHSYSGERYYFSFTMQVEAIPLEGSDIVSFHIMASDNKPWGEREKDFDTWRCYDMKASKRLGLHDMLMPEGIPFLREAINDFAISIYLGEGGEQLLVRDSDGEIPLPSEYDVALVPGMFNYSYPKGKLIEGRGMFGAVPAEMLVGYLTPMAKVALRL